ncbi:MAG: BPL-N domain-containing protein [Methanobacterium sp. ERen5]|nr:MAG: BPL-N domain-containing protein [Methanobacterium sp. ERen5]
MTVSLSVLSASAANVNLNSNSTSINTLSTKNIPQTVSTSKTTTSAAKATVSTTKVKTIKVLIYSGRGSINSCVSGVINGLHYSNSKNLVPGYKFSCGTTRTINSKTLAGYNVLVMPGGTSGLNYIKNVNGNAIKKFVSSSHGYVGICAGAYSGSKYVKGLYYGWGLAPHVYSHHISHEGNLLVKTSTSLPSLLGASKTLTLAHYNGPAMYTRGGNTVTFAYYVDNKTGHKGLKAIVGDYYGSGRTVLSGPHPELQPTNTSLLAKMVLWSAHVNKVQQIFAVSSVSPSNGAVNVAANKKITVKYTESVKLANSTINLKTSTGTSVPLTTSVSGSTITLSHPLLSIGVKYILSIASGTVVSSSGKTLNSYSSSFTVSPLTTDQMKEGIGRVQAFLTKNNRLPNYVSFGTMQIPIATFKEIIAAYGLKI